MDTDQYQFFKNAQYRNTRNEKKTLIVSILSDNNANTLGTSGEFNLDLFEPLKIDKHSEIYLDNFITINSNTSSLSLNDCGFCLTINEFNINSSAASSDDSINSSMSNSIFIPNEHSTLSDNHVCVLHKSKKFNYVCDINPCKLGRISGNITNIVGKAIFHGEEENSHTYALSNIVTPGLSESSISGSSPRYPSAGSSFELRAKFGSPSADTQTLLGGHFLSDVNANSNVIHFVMENSIIGSTLPLPFDYIGNNNIAVPKTTLFSLIFSPTGNLTFDEYTIQHFLDTNTGARLLNSPGGFVAEFLIVSKE